MIRGRALVALALAVVVVTAAPALASPHAGATRSPRTTAEPWWERRIDALIGDRGVSVAIGRDGSFWYRHLAWVPRAPASNEKLLLSMALLAKVGPDLRILTRAMAASAPAHGVIHGNLWIVGQGDPEVGGARLDALARRIAAAGVTRIEGSVVGDTGPFERDWWSPGWKRDFPADEVAIPTALTFRGNVGPEGSHIDDPELRAADYLTTALRRRGVKVVGDPRMGAPRPRLTPIASVGSAPLARILHDMDFDSVNFDAEVLGKLLAARTGHTPSIAGGAAAIHGYVAANGMRGSVQRDASGLSYADRVTTQGLVRLLWLADGQPWAAALRTALPTAGQGTLAGRLRHLRVRAKTGTLTDISALSGWVWSEKAGAWVEFSILSDDLSKSDAVRLEDAIVALVSAAAPPAG